MCEESLACSANFYEISRGKIEKRRKHQMKGLVVRSRGVNEVSMCWCVGVLVRPNWKKRVPQAELVRGGLALELPQTH